jgi:L-ascorbate metabolism protein UlaG (beta-lactamase superfamily)
MIFPRWKPRAELRPTTGSASGAQLRVRWLGTAGHIVESDSTTILIDPFLTRPGFLRLLRPLVPDETQLAKLPTKIDAVLCGHSHYDHLLDAPTIAKRSGAKLCGSASTAAFGRASGVADVLVVPPEGAQFSVGDLQIQFVPSRHGRIFLGRVPFPGEIGPLASDRTPQAISLPLRFWHYRMGGAFGIVIRAQGVTLYHNGSADLVDAQLDGLSADVLLVGLAGRKATPDYLARLCNKLRPRLLVPTHHDSFFHPLDDGVRLLPGIDLDGFVADARRIAPSASVITPDYHEVLAIPSEARAASLVG